MTSPSDIERVVMRRVRIVRLLRPVFSGVTLAALVGAFALWGIGREVWVAKVFENAPKNASGLPLFYWDAFGHTRLIVQALTLLTLASALYLAREVARALAHVLIPERA